MKSSIRKFLLINLLLAITITTTLTAIGNYYLDQKDIQDHLDTLMAVSALSYQALLGDDLHQRPLAKIQDALETIPQKLIPSIKTFLNDEPRKIISTNLIFKSGLMGKIITSFINST